MNIPDKAFTHAGHFHADDVFSAALLKLYRSDIVIERGFIVPPGYTGLVFDIGGGEFDHHSSTSPVRPSGVKYAAFGLLWREIGTEFLPPADAARFDEHFISSLDNDDNTGSGNALAGAISVFNPTWEEDEDENACFDKAVEMALSILKRKIASTKAVLNAKNCVEAAYKNSQDGIVVLEKYIPWKAAIVLHKDVKYVIYPSQRGGFCAQSVQDTNGVPTLRSPFPEEWAGKEQEELQKASGIEGLRFCHAGRFLLTGQSVETLKEACKKVLNK